MRKNKILATTCAAISSLAVATPMMSITSCSNSNTKYDAIANELQTKAIEIFEKVVCSTRHASYNCHNIYQTYCKWIEENLGQKPEVDNFYDLAEDLDSEHYEKADPQHDTVSFNNIKFDIPASSGYDNKPMLILQAHMDMVEAMAEGQEFGSTIEVVEDTEDGHKTIHSKDYKTSIGADNGAGVALMFALVQMRDKFTHGPIRCIITADEEPGMIGPYIASNKGEDLNCTLAQWVKGSKWMINIDNEDAGHLVKACSGGYSKNIVVDTYNNGETAKLESGKDFIYEIEVKGMKTCHSAEVTRKMTTAIKVAAEAINSIGLSTDNIKIIKMDTPDTALNSTNSVAQTCTATFALEREISQIDCYGYAQWVKSFVIDNYPEDSGVNISIRSLGPVEQTEYSGLNALQNTYSRAVIKLIDDLKFGPISYLDPETETKLKSSSNIGPLYLNCNDEDKIGAGYTPFMLKYYSRSIDKQEMIEIRNENDKAFSDFNTVFKTSEAKDLAVYDPWLIAEKNEMIDMLVEFYKSIGIEPSVDIIHGGVENAWWVKLNPEIQTTSIGPTIKGAHTPHETLYIDTFVDEAKAILSVVDKLLAME